MLNSIKFVSRPLNLGQVVFHFCVTDGHLMSEQNPFFCFEAQMARLMFTVQARTQNQLAEFLGVKQASISEASKRGNIPATWLVVLVQKLKVNPDWVLEARMPIFLHGNNVAQEQDRRVGRCFADNLRSVPLEELEKELCRRSKEAQ